MVVGSNPDYIDDDQEEFGRVVSTVTKTRTGPP
jgi:hypothetical protein